MHKILITGTGRNGTTFLIRLFTELGFDTGFNKKNYHKHIAKNCNAGMEKDWDAESYIVKNPEFCTKIDEIMKYFHIDMVFIPMRDLEEVAISRIKNGRLCGGLWNTTKPSEQKDILASKVGYLMEGLILNDIPHTFLKFPKFVEDHEYTYNKLLPFVKHIDVNQFKKVFYELAEKTKSRIKTKEDLIEEAKFKPTMTLAEKKDYLEKRIKELKRKHAKELRRLKRDYKN